MRGWQTLIQLMVVLPTVATDAVANVHKYANMAVIYSRQKLCW